MNRVNLSSPVGVFDSGVGGLSVLRVLKEVLPHENFIYYGDSANAPYGEKTAGEVTCVAENVVRDLLHLGAKAIVIACNTATSAAAAYLREKYTDLPIIGMEPAIKPAANCAEHPTVLVMATPLTIREEKFRRLIAKFADKADFIDVPCHGLVELIEKGITDGDVMDSYLEGLLKGHISGRRIDAAVLGCTHYIHAREAIEKALGEGVSIHDGALGTARETRHRLEEAGLLNPSDTTGDIKVINSSGSEELLRLSWELLEK
ncbi:MAG: glutamate racemase [Clostridia bacterium]|nr:glutamate racemase [Clostridia bacterium]